jgi:pyridoxamine 5'-phosphate oxidase
MGSPHWRMNPFLLLKRWHEFAVFHAIPKANAFCLSTVSARGMPSSRMLLLGSVLPEGITFFTDERSPKVRDLKDNPHASAVFCWESAHRQVRIEGIVEQLDDRFADEDFQSKPRTQQTAIVEFSQSDRVKSYRHVAERLASALASLGDQVIARPTHWRGYVLTGNRVELLLGGRNRLNKRIQFEKAPSGRWTIGAIQP